MAGPTISFCTYTYNDAEFAEDLVRQTRLFTVQPDEIIVVDDGSDIPFVMENQPSNIRIIRFERNRGITAAKGAGLTAASGDFIVSVDCDTRISNDWIERNISHAAVPEIGMVGGLLMYTWGNDLVSRYLTTFGDKHDLHHTGAVQFIPDNAFMLRREVWDRIDGLNGFSEVDCHDHSLCERMSRAGYTLFSDTRAEAWLLRRIRRRNMSKRIWKIHHEAVKQQASETDQIAAFLFNVFVIPMLDRCDDSAVLGEPLFYYLELLHLAHAVLDTLDHLMSQGQASELVRNGFIVELVELFAGYPKIQAMFRADLYAMGHDMVAGVPFGDTESWQKFFTFAQMMRTEGLFSWLDENGISMLIRDEVEEEYHVSSRSVKTYEAISA